MSVCLIRLFSVHLFEFSLRTLFCRDGSENQTNLDSIFTNEIVVDGHRRRRRCRRDGADPDLCRLCQ